MVERGPEKAGVGSSILLLGTIILVPVPILKRKRRIWHFILLVSADLERSERVRHHNFSSGADPEAKAKDMALY